MSAQKIKDLCVKVREYTDSTGAKKNVYENIGHILRMDDGSEIEFIKRTFNPAGVANPDNYDTVIISRFDVKEKAAPVTVADSAHVSAAPAPVGIDGDIPF